MRIPEMAESGVSGECECGKDGAAEPDEDARERGARKKKTRREDDGVGHEGGEEDAASFVGDGETVFERSDAVVFGEDGPQAGSEEKKGEIGSGLSVGRDAREKIGREAEVGGEGKREQGHEKDDESEGELRAFETAADHRGGTPDRAGLVGAGRNSAHLAAR